MSIKFIYFFSLKLGEGMRTACITSSGTEMQKDPNLHASTSWWMWPWALPFEIFIQMPQFSILLRPFCPLNLHKKCPTVRCFWDYLDLYIFIQIPHFSILLKPCWPFYLHTNTQLFDTFETMLTYISSYKCSTFRYFGDHVDLYIFICWITHELQV